MPSVTWFVLIGRTGVEPIHPPALQHPRMFASFFTSLQNAKIMFVHEWIRGSGFFAVVAFVCVAAGQHAEAKSPAVIAEGRMLFEKNWPVRNPTLGNDGLGPLFNGRSCAVCHSQGGVGGAGEARFNAKTIGIERMQITGGPVTSDVVKQAVRNFHPGFIGPSGSVVNTFAVSHHGGTPLFAKSRNAILKNIPAVFSSDGGPVSADEVRQASATPILYSAKSGQYQISIRARMFQRNTTPIFGAGLIDQVTGKQLEQLVRIQEANPEISGRIATLPNGRYGRFGWRGNVPSLLDFCDQACAAEVGLETKRKRQPIDPTNTEYRNPSIDITDNQIKAMTAFMAALPAPQRVMPEDSEQRINAIRGEQVFAAVGCAACHVPSVGPANGLYSDLLLHDMGYESMDLNHADPYIYRVTPVSNYDVKVGPTSKRVQTNTTGYYGGSSDMMMSGPSPSVFGNTSMTTGGDGGGLPSLKNRSRSRRGRSSPTSYDFVAPSQPRATTRFINLNEETSEIDKQTHVQVDNVNNVFRNRNGSLRGTNSGTRTTTTSREVQMTRTDLLKLTIKRTNFNQEWRTPPLWGVRDSAPYMHDGRAETLLEAIAMHDGEGAATRDRFLNLSLPDRHAVIAFLNTMVAPQNAPQPAL
ncbi:MAG: hypothetical protein HKN47_19015 [Pirellulaceae bacterium]|nr:hypothetical protein [Pirellulaceae bacterium]